MGQDDGTIFHGSYIWWRISAGETNFTYIINSATSSSWVLQEFAGCHATPYDVSEGQYANLSGITYTTPTCVPTTGNRLLVASMGASSSSADISGAYTSWLNSFTAILDNGQSAGARTHVGTAYRLVTGDGSTSFSSGVTYAANPQSRSGLIIAFKEAAGTSVTVNVTGQAATASVTSLSSVNGVASVSPTGQAVTASVTSLASVTGASPVSVTGQSVTASVGTVTIPASSTATVSVTGQSVTASVGTAVGARSLLDAWDAALVTPGIVLSGSDQIGTAPVGVSGELWSATEHATGQYYAEVTLSGSAPTRRVGLYGGTPASGAFLFANGDVHIDLDGGVLQTFPSAFSPLAQNDIVGIAFNANAGKVWFRVNGGNWNNSAAQSPYVNMSVSVFGQSVTMATTSPTVVGKANVSPTGPSMTASVGTVTVTVAGSGSYDNLANWPSASNRPSLSGSTLSWTGPVGGGVSTTGDTPQTRVLTASGAITTSATNQIIEGRLITGSITVNHDGVTIRQCALQSPSGNAQIDINKASCTRITIEDCYINGNKTSGWGIRATLGSFVATNASFIRRNHIRGYENNLTLAESGNFNLSIIDNYFTAAGDTTNPAYDGDMIEFYEGTGVTLSHNCFDGTNSQTSPGVTNAFVNLSNLGAIGVTVTNNLFANCSPVQFFVICDDNGFGGAMSWSFTNNGFFNLGGKSYRRGDTTAPSPNSGNYTAATITATSGSLINGTGQI